LHRAAQRVLMPYASGSRGERSKQGGPRIPSAIDYGRLSVLTGESANLVVCGGAVSYR